MASSLITLVINALGWLAVAFLNERRERRKAILTDFKELRKKVEELERLTEQFLQAKLKAPCSELQVNDSEEARNSSLHERTRMMETINRDCRLFAKKRKSFAKTADLVVQLRQATTLDSDDVSDESKQKLSEIVGKFMESLDAVYLEIYTTSV